MFKFIVGLIFATSISASQIRARYRVLDPFSPNGLWTEVAAASENEAPSLHLKPRIEETEQEEAKREQRESRRNEGSLPLLVEKKAELIKKQTKAKKNKKLKPMTVKIKEIRRRDEREVEEAMRPFKKNTATPYLPDLTALKQITSADPLISSPESSLETFKRNLEQNRGISSSGSNSQSKPPIHKRHRRKPAPPPMQLNVAPSMPQLPSLAAATNAPLPSSFPRWESSMASLQASHPISTSLLEMDSGSGVKSRAGGNIFPESSLSETFDKPLRTRASWPSDVSPPPDYFLPPEVLI